MNDFYDDLRIVNNEKEKRRCEERRRYELSGEAVYDDFSLWCFVFNGDKGRHNPKVFKRYLKEERIKLTFWQKKRLLENYFGYEFTFDYKNGWSVKEL